jgi:hypothetical protein
MIFITADQLVCHAIGDYVLQSDWMATEKTKRSAAALAHVATYFLPFLFLTTSWKALVFIVVTHFIIDRWRLARYACWIKNYLAPRWIMPSGAADDPITFRIGQDAKEPTKGAVPIRLRNRAWAQCSGTGYDQTKPPWMAVWLMIITDNIAHVICNALALKYLV